MDAMSEPAIDTVTVSHHPGGSQWHAVSSDGSAVGSATLRTTAPLGPALLLPPVRAAKPAAPGLNLYVEPRWRRRGIGSRLGELIDAEPPGYRLTHWTGELPDAPSVEELLRSPSRPGRALLTAADTDGDLAAYAVAIVDALFQPRVRQYGPAVLPGHRGRRLGRWVNAALIQRLREVHPYVDEIETAGVDDPHLLALHEHLGFRFFRRTHRYELTLP